ncbi:hypothetical protein NKG05_27855 [Oerskovia sp. M15]
MRPGQVVVGFAAETGDENGDVLHHGRAGAPQGRGPAGDQCGRARQGFGTDTNEVTIVDAQGETVACAAGTKREVADAVWDTVLKMSPPLVPTTP